MFPYILKHLLFFLDILRGIDLSMGLFLIGSIFVLRANIKPLLQHTALAKLLFQSTFVPYVASLCVVGFTLVSLIPLPQIFNSITLLQFQLQILGTGVLLYMYDWLTVAGGIFYNLTNKKLLFVAHHNTQADVNHQHSMHISHG